MDWIRSDKVEQKEPIKLEVLDRLRRPNVSNRHRCGSLIGQVKLRGWINMAISPIGSGLLSKLRILTYPDCAN